MKRKKNIFIDILIKPVPRCLWKTYSHYFIVATVFAAVGTTWLSEDDVRLSSFCFVSAAILWMLGAMGKMKVLAVGYKELEFEVYDLTYICPEIIKNQKPTGMLLFRNGDVHHYKKYHVAIKSYKVPEIGDTVKVLVPATIEEKCSGDRFYFPIVFDYSIEKND